MKIFLLVILVHLTCGNIYITTRYHETIGIPEAAQLKQIESSSYSGRIINGYHVSLGKFPYFGGLLIALSSGMTSVCGSTLISDMKAITAAHCWTDGFNRARLFELVLGSVTLFNGGTRIITNQVTVHEDYNASTVRNDIAIITIPKVILNTNIQPIKLPNTDSTFERVEAQIVGFGRTQHENININQQLSSAYVLVDTGNQCAAMYGYFYTTSMVCTEGRYSGPCGGDSGGPLLYKNEVSESVLIGVISYGSGYGCDVGHPSVYTRINNYIDWIAARL